MPSKHTKKIKKTARKPKGAVYAYISKCCEAPTEKPALTIPDGNRIGRLGSRPDTSKSDLGLGKFRCTKCRKPTKVTRVKPQAESAAA